ncbi:hypothetical protein I317_07327 [Kwoniella heveanensis CBS 569]|uniref:F-box domain-containing protein n=1 Tax=Kwoniella heveanensis BCC8398 TaxID=1296120 RepID=A0A1B9H3C9_9TREE|nr:hypothetical protein I316_00896 [Kwoniella heveanensis BCC8398]OCF38878.1 hypothetical protein I317_07327 [Kwoniella heveanensis CBS 569]
MLDQIPPEIISQIAFHLVISPSPSSSSSSSFSFHSSSPLHAPGSIPPQNLLLTSRSIHDAIAPANNPRLYGRLFRALFDTDAAERRMRLVPSSVVVTLPTAEAVGLPDGGADEVEDKLMTSPPSTSAETEAPSRYQSTPPKPTKRSRKKSRPEDQSQIRAQDFTNELRRRIEVLSRLKDMIARRDVSELRDDDLWTVYFMLIENDGKNAEYLIGPKAVAHLPTFLDLYHEQHLLTAAVEPGYPAETVGRSLAMWIAWLVGGAGPADETPEQREERMFVLRPYVFAAQQYQLYFAPWVLPDLPLQAPIEESDSSNPFIADLSPKSRLITVRHYGRDLEICPPFLAHAAILRFFYRRPGDDLDDEIMDGLLPSRPPTRPPTRPASPSSTQHFLLSNSAIHDRDYQRLRRCYDPSITKGLRPPAWRGSWDGCWEGTFSFFDFDAFREMLAGHARALYEGPYGEQAQVWRLKETYSGLPLSGPMVNAGFPPSEPPNTYANLASAAAEAETLAETIKQQIDAIEGYEIVPEDELDEMLSLEDGGEEAGLEMLLTGTGHSAWGKFILKGRVRGWDGMASLVKEYAPDSRGKWIYRGYVLAGDIFVGRWRDTYTPETFVGYEGTFILNRR